MSLVKLPRVIPVHLKALCGTVSAMRKKFGDSNGLEISAGYKWERDYDSTDDESLWQRLGFGLSLMSTPRSESNSVSSGDYCIHDYQ